MTRRPLRLTQAEARDLAAHLSDTHRAAKGSEVGKLIQALASGRGVEVSDDPQ